MLRRGAAECRSGVYAPSPQILVNCGQARTELRARGPIDRRHPATSARPEWLGSKDPAPATRRGFYLRWPYAEAARGHDSAVRRQNFLRRAEPVSMLEPVP